MDCPVCTESLGPETAAAACASCAYKTCRSCARRFVLTTVDARCMSCRHPWDREFMDATLGSAWVNGEYKRHRETILLDRERAMLPAAQDRLGTYREYKELTGGLQGKKARAREMRKELRALDAEISGDFLHATHLKHRAFAPAAPAAPVRRPDAPAPPVAPPPKRVVRGCPTEDCRGFLTSDFRCGACERTFCPRCHEELGDAHACDPDAAKAAAFIVKDTKPCPTCAAPIHKISGCSQMWCTLCRTPFDWRTGEVDRGPVHNPHYVAWVNTRGGAAAAGDGGDGGRCGGGWAAISARLRAGGMEPHALASVGEVHRVVLHLQRVVLPTLPGNAEVDNLDLRLQYLNNEVTEEHVRQTVQRREKKRAKLLAVRQILEMYVAATGDVLASAGLGVAGELKELRALTDGHLDDVAKRFAMKVPSLADYGQHAHFNYRRGMYT